MIISPEQLERVKQIVQNYAPHHDELRAYDRAWFAMGSICDALGIPAGEPEEEGQEETTP
jgi:hypothetical protein